MASFIERKLLQQSHLYIPNIVNSLKSLNCIFVVDDAIFKSCLTSHGAPEESISEVDNISDKTRFVLGNSHLFQELQLNHDNVHYTKYISSGSSLAWIESKRGSDMSVLRNICLIEFSLVELDHDIIGNSINIICGDRGSGKTRYLQNVKEKIEKDDISTQTKYVNPISIRKFLRDYLKVPSEDSKAITFLKYLELPAEDSDIVLFVDGVDDMHKSETLQIIEILQDIHKNYSLIKLWITCVTHIARDALEKCCGTFVLYLSPLTEEQRRTYLQEELAERDDLEVDVESFIHGSLAIGGSWRWPSCFHTMDSNDCPNEESFISLPLHLNFISKLADVPSDLLCVYNDYTLRKLEEFIQADKDLLESCLTQLAMLSLFEDAVEKFPMLRNVLAMLETRMESDWSDKFICVDGKIVQFEHKSVRDFLAAKWIANNYSMYREKISECLSCGLCTNIFSMFFNRHLAEDSSLHLLVIDHNYERFTEVLPHDDGSHNSKDRGGRTPLHLAAITGASDIAKLLLERGADPNALDDVLLWTPIRYADLSQDFAATIEVLLLHGADVKDMRTTNNAPVLEIGRRLDKAIQNKCLTLIKYICNNCKRLRITSKQVYEALESIRDESVLNDILRVAESNPAMIDPEYSDACGYTALFLAVEQGNLKAVQFLVENLAYNMKAKAFYDKSLLHVACEKGHKEIARYLLDKGADINSVTKRNVTPFGECCRNGHLETAKMLHEAGADITIDDLNESNLKAAAIAGHLDMVEYLIEKRGMERNILNAIYFIENLDVIKTLIKSGADVNCQDAEGCTPLHQVYNANLDVIKLLINHGADCNALNHSEEPPIFRMSQAEDAENKIKELLDYGADLMYTKSNGENIMHTAGSEVIPFLIASGIDVNSRTNTGETPLHTACAEIDSSVVAALLENGADPEARTEAGVTPLHYACTAGSIDRKSIELLVNAGADINVKDTEAERTPIFYAIENADTTEVLEILVRLGADLNIKDKYGLTPLHYACRMGYLQCVKFLTENTESQESINEVDETGNTPLHYAASDQTPEKGLFQRKDEIICHLIENLKAKTDIPNQDGKTVQDLVNDNDNMRKYLKEKIMKHIQEQ